MAFAAIPDYVPASVIPEASPGLRFGMFLPIWGEDRRSRERLWGLEDRDYQVSGPQKLERSKLANNKRPALEQACRLNPGDRELMLRLAERQQQQAAQQAARTLLRLQAISTAPFTTGLGLEHPLENGFAFLNPYGLPYLPGSGVKGVLRDAAEELGWIPGETQALFGSNLQDQVGADGTQLLRGALQFWDVIPQVQGDPLMVDVMTPHQTRYYQADEPPHDSGSPTPIVFLTVPPGSGFTFHVACDLSHLQRHAPELTESGRWQARVTEAFELAFDWLGFGAKTAVGYGAMRRDLDAERKAHRQAEAQAAIKQREAQDATMSAAQRAVRNYEEQMAQRHTQLAGRKTKVGEAEYGAAQQLARQAQSTEWTLAERMAAADAIERWAAKLINIDAKDLRKKLGLAALRAAV